MVASSWPPHIISSPPPTILLHRKAYHSSYDQMIQRSRQTPCECGEDIGTSHTLPGFDLGQVGHLLLAATQAAISRCIFSMVAIKDGINVSVRIGPNLRSIR